MGETPMTYIYGAKHEDPTKSMLPETKELRNMQLSEATYTSGLPKAHGVVR
jgi:hypothetical protein